MRDLTGKAATVNDTGGATQTHVNPDLYSYATIVANEAWYLTVGGVGQSEFQSEHGAMNAEPLRR